MTMRNIFKLVYWGAIFVFVVSCGDFADMNVDPNNSNKPYTKGLIPKSIYNMADYVGRIQGSLNTQQLSQVQYTTESRYTTKRWDFGWKYRQMNSYQTIINLNTDAKTRTESGVKSGGTTDNQIAIARIMRAFELMRLTDAYGPIPVSEALQGAKNWKPKYDDQEQVYTFIFSELNSAVAQIKEDGDLFGDILFEGDMKKWKQFANSIAVVASLRLADVKGTVAKAIFVKAIAGAADFDIKVKYLKDPNYQNPWYKTFTIDKRFDDAVSVPMIKQLKDTEDARLAIYADKSESKKDYIGMPYGVKTPVIRSVEISLLGSAVRKQDTPSYLITKSQILFSKAEAAQRGWITGGFCQSSRVLRGSD